METIRATFLILTMALMTTACANGDGGRSSAPVNTPAAVQPVYQEPTDYSKIACGDVEECETTCSVSAPFTSEAYIRTHRFLCNSTTGSTCNVLLSRELDGHVTGHLACLAAPVTAQMMPDEMDGPDCASMARCQSKCARLFRPETDNAIQNRATGGALMIELIANERIRVQLQACLESPASYVLNN